MSGLRASLQALSNSAPLCAIVIFVLGLRTEAQKVIPSQ